MGWEFRYLAYYNIRITELQTVSNKLTMRIVHSALS